MRSEDSLRIAPAAYDDPVVRRLDAEVQQEYVERYGGPDETAVDATEFVPPGGLFLVGWVGDRPVATGALRRHDADSAEVKRMFVPRAERRHGYARAMLAALEEHARGLGYRRIVLETGAAQPEAIALYESNGYRPIEGFGHYRDSPLSRSFAKDLPDSSYDSAAETRRTYSTIAGAYAERHHSRDQGTGWLYELLDDLVELSPQGAVVLDLGCGPATHVAYLQDHGLRGLGLDLSTAMLAQAPPEVAGRLVAARMQQLPVRTASVDAVWSSFALLHVPAAELPVVLAEVRRVLAPAGHALLTFAGGATGPYREEVEYAPGLFRTFHPVAPEQVAASGALVGLTVLRQGPDPEAQRDAHHALLAPGEPARRCRR